MMDDNDLARPEKLLGDDDGPERFDSAASSVADDVGVAFRNTKGLGWVDSCVHAYYHCDLAGK